MFAAPAVAKYGLGPADQAWIDETIEAGVAACAWPRPARLDVPPPPAKRAVPQGIAGKKKHWWSRKPKATAPAPAPAAAPAAAPWPTPSS